MSGTIIRGAIRTVRTTRAARIGIRGTGTEARGRVETTVLAGKAVAKNKNGLGLVGGRVT